MMNQEQAYTAIIQCMQSFTGIEQAKIKYPNSPIFTPPDEGIWLRFVVNWGGAFISGLAEKPCTRKTGVVQIQVFDRPHNHEINMERMTDKLLDHFQYYSISHLEFLQGQSSSTQRDNDFVWKTVSIGFRVN